MMMKFLKHSVLAIALIAGFSLCASAQQKPDERPEKKPPVIVPRDKKPKDDKPKGDKKPGGEFVAYIEETVVE